MCANPGRAHLPFGAVKVFPITKLVTGFVSIDVELGFIGLLVRESQSSSRDGLTITETSMNFILQPWQLMILIIASWINRHQQEVID